MYDLKFDFKPVAEGPDITNTRLVAQIVRAMAHMGHPCFLFKTENERWKLRFRTVHDDLLHSISVTLYPDRRGPDNTTPTSGTTVALTIDAELRYHLPNIEDLISIHGEQLWKVEVPGAIRLHHVGNSIVARTSEAIDVRRFLGGDEAHFRALCEWLETTVSKLQELFEPLRPAR